MSQPCSLGWLASRPTLRTAYPAMGEAAAGPVAANRCGRCRRVRQASWMPVGTKAWLPRRSRYDVPPRPVASGPDGPSVRFIDESPAHRPRDPGARDCLGQVEPEIADELVVALDTVKEARRPHPRQARRHQSHPGDRTPMSWAWCGSPAGLSNRPNVSKPAGETPPRTSTFG